MLPTISDPSTSSASSRTSTLASKFKKYPTPTSEELDILFEEFYNSKPIQEKESQVINEPIPNNDPIQTTEPVPDNNRESSSNSSKHEESSSSDI